MNKLSLLLFLVTALVITGCNRTKANVNKEKVVTTEQQDDIIPETVEAVEITEVEPDEPEMQEVILWPYVTAMDYSQCDFLFLNEGQMFFCDVETEEIAPFTEETDSVLNAVYSLNNELYYTVSDHGKLKLRYLDLSESSPKPVALADWNLDVQDAINWNGGPYGNMSFNEDHTQIGLGSDMQSYVYYKLSIYDLETGEVSLHTQYQDDEYGYYEDAPGQVEFEPYNPKRIKLAEFCYDWEERQGDMGIAYRDGGKLIELCDRLDPDSGEVIPIEVDPKHEHVLFLMARAIGIEGVNGDYAFASLDGKHQCIIPGCDPMLKREPQWLKNGSLVFVGYDEEYEPKLQVIDMDENIKPVAYTLDFIVKPN